MEHKFLNFRSGAQLGPALINGLGGILVNVPDSGHSENSILRTIAYFNSVGPYTLKAMDSGGFQEYEAEYGKNPRIVIYDPSKPINHKGYLNLTPKHIVETALRLNPDIMFSLDMPVPKETHKGRQNILFMKSNTFNVRCAKEIAKLREKYCPEIEFFIPVQAYDLDHFDYFMNDLGNTQYDGLSLPNRLFTMEKVALFLMKFHLRGVRKAHILGSTRFDLLAALSYFARHYFEFLSVDSTSWQKFATVQVYQRPYGLDSFRLDNNAIIDESQINVCKCPWCKGKTFSYIKNMINSDKAMFLSAHNLWVTEQAMREFFAHAETPESLRDFLMSKTNRKKDIDRVYKTLSMIHSVRHILTDDYLRILYRQMCEK